MTFAQLIDKIIGVVELLIPIVVGIALVIFLYGLTNYILNSGDESKRQESVQYIIYGLIGLFVMVGIWGIVEVFSSIFGQGISIPQLE